MSSQTFFILGAIVFAQIGGDYFVKNSAEHSNGIFSTVFLLGALLYGATAVGWYYLMRIHSLAEIGVLYSASTIILLAVLGHFVFKEEVGLRQLAGMALAVLAIFVMREP